MRSIPASVMLALLQLSDERLDGLVMEIKRQRGKAPPPRDADPVTHRDEMIPHVARIAAKDPTDDPRAMDAAWVALACEKCSGDFIAPGDVPIERRCYRCLSRTKKSLRVALIAEGIERLGPVYSG